MFRFSRERGGGGIREREMGKNQDVKDGQKDEERGKMDGKKYGEKVWRDRQGERWKGR